MVGIPNMKTIPHNSECVGRTGLENRQKLAQADFPKGRRIVDDPIAFSGARDMASLA